MSKKKNKAWVAIIIWLLLCTILVYNYFADKKKLEQQYRYSVAIVTDYHATSNSGHKIYYFFIVQNEKINQTDYPFLRVKEPIGKRFFVKYYPVDPNNSEILLDQPVPDTLQHIPPNGWEELPVKK